MTKPARFTQSDLARALKGAEIAGARVAVCRIEPNGAIELRFGGEGAANDPGGPNEWDEVLE